VKAEAFYKRALEACEHLLSPKHRDTLTAVGGLGWLYESMGEYTKAETFFNRALEARERLLGPEHPSTLAICYNLAELLSTQGRHT
jgi:tetratricopeptide (TPR) repeat protein